MTALQSQLEPEVGSAMIVCKQVKYLRRDTIRAGANGQAYDIVNA